MRVDQMELEIRTSKTGLFNRDPGDFSFYLRFDKKAVLQGVQISISKEVIILLAILNIGLKIIIIE
jgi:RNA binding exosome subunit